MGVEPTDTQAKLLLSAMMTDTLMLKSPTATAVDAAIAAKLGEQLGVDPVKFGMEVFLTRPSGSFTAAEMVGNDIKMFEVAGTKLLIGQYETVDKSRALGMIPEIREAMRAYQADKAADGIVLCITDIMEEGSQVLLEGETVVAQKGLQIEDVAEGVWMPGVLSRTGPARGRDRRRAEGPSDRGCGRGRVDARRALPQEAGRRAESRCELVEQTEVMRTPCP